MITNMRERIKEALIKRNAMRRIPGSWSAVWEDEEPSEQEIDRVERLFNEMLAEQKVGNGS
jgi:hypothetical protein